MNVLWVSRHIPGDAEEDELRVIYGPDTAVLKYSVHVTMIYDIVLAAQKHDCGIVCANLPIKVNQRLLADLSKVNIPLIRPVYYHRDLHGNVTANTRGKFMGFEEIQAISVISVRIGSWGGTSGEEGGPN